MTRVSLYRQPIWGPQPTGDRLAANVRDSTIRRGSGKEPSREVGGSRLDRLDPPGHDIQNQAAYSGRSAKLRRGVLSALRSPRLPFLLSLSEQIHDRDITSSQ